MFDLEEARARLNKLSPEEVGRLIEEALLERDLKEVTNQPENKQGGEP